MTIHQSPSYISSPVERGDKILPIETKYKKECEAKFPRGNLMSIKKTTYGQSPYNFADLQSGTLKYVLLDPRRIVAPIWVFDPYERESEHFNVQNDEAKINLHLIQAHIQLDTSGINTTQGCEVSGSNSVLFVSHMPRTERANSITAICIPRQMPRNGTLFSRAYFAARIFPCTPLSPNPPGTSTPSAPWIGRDSVCKLRK